MATWTKNVPSGSATRRKWNLEDRASLNNLKYHIAAEGCSEVQYDLAKQLLDRSIEQNEETSNQQAVHWLTCAAQQGHEEAINLLQKCYDDGCGITSENEYEVHSCLSMTSGERAARKAARELFACLSNGGKHITPKQLEKKMREIYKMQKQRRRYDGSGSSSTSEDDIDSGELEDKKKDNSTDQSFLQGSFNPITNGSVNLSTLPRHPQRKRRNRKSDLNVQQHQQPRQHEHITEENLVSAAVNYAAGFMPSVNNAMTLSVPHPASLDHVPCFHRLLFHPTVFLTLLYHRFINVISGFPHAVPPSIRLTILFMLYWLLTTDNLTVMVPVIFYTITWIVMVWSSCRMLKTKHEFIDFRIWSGLFLSYGDHNIEADMSENRFLKNNLQPYVYFFAAFMGNLLVYPVLRADWLPHSELTIIAGIFAFVSMIAFMYTQSQPFPDWIVLISFGVNVLAKYPYEMDEVVTTGWRFLDLKVPTFCSFVIGNGIEFCLNCRTALYLLIPVFLIHLAKRANWHGTYKHLIPHCVSLSWLQLCINSAQSATMFGMVRAALGLAGVLLFLPLFGLVSLLVPVFVTIEWLGFTNPNVRLGSTVVASILALLLSCFLAINRTTQKYITIMQVVICIAAACILTFPYMTSNFKDSTRFNSLMSNLRVDSVISDGAEMVQRMPPPPAEHLSWQKFYMHCGAPAWRNNNNNKVTVQLKCSQLEGLDVAWEGEVTQVQIGGVKNPFAWYLQKFLPQWLAHLITCYWGEHIDHNKEKCLSEHDTLCLDFQNILKYTRLRGKCSLQKWNYYEYEIRVKMSSGLLSKGPEVILQATDKFGNFTKHLAAGDRIHFYGTLINPRMRPDVEEFIVNDALAQVRVTAIECVLCQDDDIRGPVILDAFIKSPVDARMRDLMRGITYLLNVLFNPLITFK